MSRPPDGDDAPREGRIETAHLRRSIICNVLMIADRASVQFIVWYLQLSADMAFIGNYDTAGLAAIHNVRTTYQFLLAFLLAFTNGMRFLVSQSVGRGSPKTAAAVRDASLLFNQLVSFGYLAFWQIGGRWLLATLGAEGIVFEMGGSYVRVLSLVFSFACSCLSHAGTPRTVGWRLPVCLRMAAGWIARRLLSASGQWPQRVCQSRRCHRRSRRCSHRRSHRDCPINPIRASR